jgi:hypothetical protein
MVVYKIRRRSKFPEANRIRKIKISPLIISEANIISDYKPNKKMPNPHQPHQHLNGYKKIISRSKTHQETITKIKKQKPISSIY